MEVTLNTKTLTRVLICICTGHSEQVSSLFHKLLWQGDIRYTCIPLLVLDFLLWPLHILQFDSKFINLCKSYFPYNICWWKVPGQLHFVIFRNDIGDEFHYILQCRYFEQNHKHLIPSYFRNRPNVLKFKNIMTVTKISDLLKLQSSR